jgi:DNA polymerase I-like protein with 3'-5' exonuclease and polymerase domains
MDSLAKRYLGYDTIRYEDVAGKGAKQIPFSQVALDEAARYAAEDADITLRLHRALRPKLRPSRHWMRCTARSRCRWCRCWRRSRPTAC